MLTRCARAVLCRWMPFVCVGLLAACDDGAGDEPPRRAPIDVGALDGGTPDTTLSFDAAPGDAEGDLDLPDGELPDAGWADDGSGDTGWLDLAVDVALPDGELPDGELPDGEVPDSELSDGELLDGELLDAGWADASPDAGDDPRCAAWRDVADDALPRALHAALHDSYRPIDAELDRGGNPNRYTTARALMFNDVELEVDRDDRYGNECLYTGEFVRSAPDAEPDNDVMNCEHTWPRARMDDEDASPLLYSHQQSDLHHLYPTISGANSRRGSDRFGVVARERDLSYLPSVAGLDAAGNPVFEPRDARKGDVARVIFYFSVRWGKPIRDDEEAALRAWVEADPVSARERGRNDRVEALQGNRNPFVDCPALVDRIADFEGFEIIDAEDSLPAP